LRPSRDLASPRSGREWVPLRVHAPIRRVRMSGDTPVGVEIRGREVPGSRQVLTRDALAFVAELTRRFRETRERLLADRHQRQRGFDQGKRPDFLPHTSAIRSSEWTVGPAPADLEDRRVEITGPVDAKMMINALNSGAQIFMADFEDA